MLTLKIENENVEKIFLNEFHSNKEQFFEFIQNSYEAMKLSHQNIETDKNLIEVQENSMQKTWDNVEDKVWDDL